MFENWLTNCHFIGGDGIFSVTAFKYKNDTFQYFNLKEDFDVQSLLWHFASLLML
jgi:hypothetical protein